MPSIFQRNLYKTFIFRLVSLITIFTLLISAISFAVFNNNNSQNEEVAGAEASNTTQDSNSDNIEIENKDQLEVDSNDSSNSDSVSEGTNNSELPSPISPKTDSKEQTFVNNLKNESKENSNNSNKVAYNPEEVIKPFDPENNQEGNSKDSNDSGSNNSDSEDFNPNNPNNFVNSKPTWVPDVETVIDDPSNDKWVTEEDKVATVDPETIFDDSDGNTKPEESNDNGGNTDFQEGDSNGNTDSEETNSSSSSLNSDNSNNDSDGNTDNQDQDGNTDSDDQDDSGNDDSDGNSGKDSTSDKVTPIYKVSKRYGFNQNPDGTYAVEFSYIYDGDKEIEIPVGENNKFTTGDQDRGQFTTFKPGKKKGIFTVNVPCSETLTWQIIQDGTISSAKLTTPNCEAQETQELIAPKTGEYVLRRVGGENRSGGYLYKLIEENQNIITKHLPLDSDLDKKGNPKNYNDFELNQEVSLGNYNEGEEIKLMGYSKYTKQNSFSYNSEDADFRECVNPSENCFQIAFEDGYDTDFNDLVVEVELKEGSQGDDKEEDQEDQLESIEIFAVNQFELEGKRYATFGYESNNSQPIAISVGENNDYSDTFIEGDVPTVFELGKHEFRVQYFGESLVWSLKTSPEAETKTATVNTQTKTLESKEAKKITQEIKQKQAVARTQKEYLVGQYLVRVNDDSLKNNSEEFKNILGRDDVEVEFFRTKEGIINDASLKITQLNKDFILNEETTNHVNFGNEIKPLAKSNNPASLDNGIKSKLENDSRIDFVEFDGYVEKANTNDPFVQSGDHWHFNNTGQTIRGKAGKPDADIDAFEAWEDQTGSSDVLIAVIDDGIDLDHPDLAPNIWTNPNEIPNNGIDDDNNGYVDDVEGYDVSYGGPDNDVDWQNPPLKWGHGTHVAGTIAGKGNNNQLGAGVCHDCQMVGVKVFHNSGASNAIIIEAINYATNLPEVDIINMSLGGGPYSQIAQDAVTNAHNQGIIVIAAAGNTYTDGLRYPASYDNVISVANINNMNKKSASSTYNEKVDISAPGTDILATLPFGQYATPDCNDALHGANNDGYGYCSGTSMATPVVSGVAGLLLSQNPNLTPAQFEGIIKSTADDVYADNPSYIGKLGAGRVNAKAALDVVIINISHNITDTNAGSTANGTIESNEVVDIEVTLENIGNVDFNGVQGELTTTDPEITFVSNSILDFGDILTSSSATQTFQVNLADFSGLEKTVNFELKVTDNDGFEKTQNIQIVFSRNINDTTVATTPQTWNFDSGNENWTPKGEWYLADDCSSVVGSNADPKYWHFGSNPCGDYSDNSQGKLYSPVIELTSDDNMLSFDSWLGIENFSDLAKVKVKEFGQDDDEAIEIQTDLCTIQIGGNSVCDSNGIWEKKEYILPNQFVAGDKVIIFFEFQSDNNVYKKGWYVDNISIIDAEVFLNSHEFTDVNSTLPNNIPNYLQVGETIDLNFEIEALGSLEGVTARIESSDTNVTFVTNNISLGNLSNQVASGTLQFTLDSVNLNYELPINLIIEDNSGYYKKFELKASFIELVNAPQTWNFDSGNENWTPKGEWYLADDCSSVVGSNADPKYWHFGSNPCGDYSDNSQGKLYSPVIELTSDDNMLSFDSWLGIENFSDLAKVKVKEFGQDDDEAIEIQTDLCTIQIGGNSVCDSNGIWEKKEYILPNQFVAGDKVIIFFEFQSDDIVYEKGWYVDNISISGSGPITACGNSPFVVTEDFAGSKFETGTIFWAIECANQNPGQDTITFDLPGSYTPDSPAVIDLEDVALPTITDSIIIDGGSQDGYAGEPVIGITRSTPQIEGASEYIFHILGTDNSEIKGLAMYGSGGGNEDVNIYLEETNNTLVADNYIGMKNDGLTSDQSFAGKRPRGIEAQDPSNLTIRNNLISNNSIDVEIEGKFNDLIVEDNLIGTDKTGLYVAGNVSAVGVELSSSNDNFSEGVIIRNNTIASQHDAFVMDIMVDGKVRDIVIENNNFSLGKDRQTPLSYAFPESETATRYSIYFFINSIIEGAIIKDNYLHNALYNIAIVGETSESNVVEIYDNSFNVDINGNSLPGYGITTDNAALYVTSFSFALKEANNILFRNNELANYDKGVIVNKPESKNIQISNNLIFEINVTAIDLGNDGITPNDIGDIDTGPNNLVNFPVINSAIKNGIDLQVNLCARPGAVVELFKVGNSSLTHGGAVEMLDEVTMPTETSGNCADASEAEINHVIPATSLALGDYITATATIDQSQSSFGIGKTSEFSENVEVVLPLNNSTLTGKVFKDEDSNGFYGGEPGVAGVEVKLLQNNLEINSTTTDTNGEFSFDSLAKGDNYQIQVINPDTINLEFTTQFASSTILTDDNNSDVDQATGLTPNFSINQDENITYIDAGLRDINANTPPTISQTTFTVDENSTDNILDLQITDNEGNFDPSLAGAITVINSPNGTTNVDTATGNLIFTPTADYFGNTIVEFEICDDLGLCGQFIIDINILENIIPTTPKYNFVTTTTLTTSGDCTNAFGQTIFINSQILTIDSNDVCYNDLQTAISQTNSGEDIYVLSGSYNPGRLEINKTLNILGDENSKPILNFGAEDILSFAPGSDNSSLKNFELVTLHHSPEVLITDIPNMTTPLKNITIENNYYNGAASGDINNSRKFIFIYGLNNPVNNSEPSFIIKNNNIENISNFGRTGRYDLQAMQIRFYSHNVIIENNNIKNTDRGIELDTVSGTANSIKNNTFETIQKKAIQIAGIMAGDIIIENNTTNNVNLDNDPKEGAINLHYTLNLNGKTLIIRNNNLTSNTYGIAAEEESGQIPILTPGVLIIENNILSGMLGDRFGL